MPVRVPLRLPNRSYYGSYSANGSVTVPPIDAAPSTLSVIITSHNYGRYLEAAILSVLAQSRPADEILVVDDGSTDDTRSIAERFAGDGVKYLRVEFRNVHKARHAGFQATTGDTVMFLDADNYLSRDYLRNGLQEFTHRHVGVVYADLQRFGLRNERTTFPEFSRAELLRENFVDACALIRREALEVCDAFSIDVDPRVTQEDHLLFQRLAADSWDFRKQRSVLMYRMHETQMSKLPGRSCHRQDDFSAHGLPFHDITLFIPLSGRDFAWDEQSQYLQRQTWPHDQIRLILCDTSQRPEFSQQLRDWIAGCDYRDVRHFAFEAGTKGLAQANRYHRPTEHEVQLAMCRIYNRLRSALETDYCWILEDDIIPPDDMLERLLRHFRKDVATVCAPYLSRWDPDYVVWLTDRETGDGRLHRAPRPAPNASQVTEIRGSGFGCLVARSHLINNHIFTIPRGEPYYDPHFFRMIGDDWNRLCDWTCECRHLGFRGHRANR